MHAKGLPSGLVPAVRHTGGGSRFPVRFQVATPVAHPVPGSVPAPAGGNDPDRTPLGEGGPWQEQAKGQGPEAHPPHPARPPGQEGCLPCMWVPQEEPAASQATPLCPGPGSSPGVGTRGVSLRKAHPLLQGAASLEPCWEPLSEGHPEPWDKPGNDNLKERYFREGEGLPVGTQTVGPPACSWEGGQAGGALAGASAPSG